MKLMTIICTKTNIQFSYTETKFMYKPLYSDFVEKTRYKPSPSLKTSIDLLFIESGPDLLRLQRTKRPFLRNYIE